MKEITGDNGDVDYLIACPGCDNVNFCVLEPPSDHRVFLTDADEMVVTTGVCGCDQCGLIFLNPRMGQKKLFKYYSKQSRIPRTLLDPSSPFARLMELQLDLIEKLKPIESGRRALEIGCAEGFFLQRLKKRSKKGIELFGVELSEKYIDQAKINLINATIFETPLEHTDFKGLLFDFIVLRHVFEHLSNPVESLKKIRGILAPGGVLYIEVPDSDSISPSVSRFYHHEHLLYFSPDTLVSHLSSNGFKPLVCERFEENPVGSGFSYPVVRSVSIAANPATGGQFTGHPKESYQRNKALQAEYIDILLSPVRLRLKQLNERKKRIGVFGAGPHTMDLLGILEPDRIDLKKIFDNSPSKQGKQMRGIPIVKPDAASLNSVDCVLVSSAEFEKEMVVQIRTLTNNLVEIITIYSNEPTN